MLSLASFLLYFKLVIDVFLGFWYCHRLVICDLGYQLA